MPLRMFSLWFVGALLVAATLKADPPVPAPEETAYQVIDQVVSEKQDGSPLASADSAVVEQFTEHFDGPASSKPVDTAAVGDTNVTAPSANPTQVKTHNGVLGEENIVEKSVWFQVRVYEVDHSQWATEQDAEKRKQALDEMLRPWIGSSRGSKLEQGNVKAWTTKTTAPASEIEKLAGAVRLVSEQKHAVDDGQTGTFDYGGKTPQLRLFEQKNGSTSEGNSQVQPLATTFVLESTVTDAGRLLVSVNFNPYGEFRKTVSTNEEKKKDGVKAAAELSVGQTLCLSDARPESSDNADSLLVTITPYEIVTREVEERIPPAAVAPAEPKELEITVEDRWPVADIKVGQRVIAIPVTIEKTSLQADLTALAFSAESKSSQRVTCIEPLPDQAGRRVTVSVPFTRHEEADDQLKAIVENYLDGIRSSASTFVIPASMFAPTDLMSGRPVHELYSHIPVEMRPRPVELIVGESFIAYGVAALMGSANEGVKKCEIGALSFDYLDDDGGGIWRATATRTGTARLIQLPFGGEMVGPFRLTEYLVKTDTRELELHIRQQFPTARVTVTSVGAAALMLKGTVASDEDVRGLVELAEQFAPKVLNRLKNSGQGGEPLAMPLEASPIQGHVQQARIVSRQTDVTRPHRSSDDPQPEESGLERILNAEFPNGELEIQIVGHQTIVSGGPYSTTDAAKIIQTVENFSENIVNQLVIEPTVPASRTPVTQPQPERLREPPRNVSLRDAELRELLGEIRELRQAVRTLNERLERERPAMDESSRTEPPGPDENAETHKRLIGDSVSNLLERASEASRAPNAGDVSGEKNQPDSIGVASDTDNEGPETPTTASQRERAGRSREEITNGGKESRQADDDATLIIRIYCVAELLIPAQPMHMQFRVDENKSEQLGLDKPVLPANSLAQLREMIKSTIAPDSWEESSGNGQITVSESTLSLVVRQTREVHEELRSLLDALRRFSGQQVSLELQVIRTDEESHGIGFDLPFAWKQLKPNESQLLNSRDADAIIAAAQREQQTGLFRLPKLTLMAGQPMTLEVTGSRLPAPLHLSGFAMPLAADGHGFARLRLSARGTDENAVVQNLSILRDGHSLLINLTNAIRSGPQEGVPILEQMPHQDRFFKNVSATKSLKPGEQLFLLATPRLIAPEAVEELLPGLPR